jgi:ribonuclease P protein component
MGVPSSNGGGPRAAGNSRLATSERCACESAGSRVRSGAGSGFPKSQRLLKRNDFQRVYDAGRRWSGPYFSVIYAPGAGSSRVGFTVPRSMGKAVVRNRLKRRIREAVRHELWRLASAGSRKAWDFVFHPRKPVLTAPLAALRAEVEKLFTQCAKS